MVYISKTHTHPHYIIPPPPFGPSATAHRLLVDRDPVASPRYSPKIQEGSNPERNRSLREPNTPKISDLLCHFNGTLQF